MSTSYGCGMKHGHLNVIGVQPWMQLSVSGAALAAVAYNANQLLLPRL